ncbi:hypothetical protein KKG46_00805 [Patescibacteria group bacterium]|nr:hypothetical protein [Patescibacteria group bacterium]
MEGGMPTEVYVAFVDYDEDGIQVILLDEEAVAQKRQDNELVAVFKLDQEVNPGEMVIASLYEQIPFYHHESPGMNFSDSYTAHLQRAFQMGVDYALKKRDK